MGAPSEHLAQVELFGGDETASTDKEAFSFEPLLSEMLATSLTCL